VSALFCSESLCHSSTPLFGDALAVAVWNCIVEISPSPDANAECPSEAGIAGDIQQSDDYIMSHVHCWFAIPIPSVSIHIL